MRTNDKPLKTIKSTFDRLKARARAELRDEAARGAHRLHRANARSEAWSVIVQAKECGNALLELTPYAIRHTVACEMRKRGVPVWEVAGFLGHSSGYRTTERYAKYGPDHLDAAVRAIDAYFDDLGVADRPHPVQIAYQLLTDIRTRRVDTVVVYKVDRLTRSLADFAKIVEVFDTHGVSFVSVTQQFNTTTSMGRLTLNMLLSFAQFEREITGERIRDKIAASKKKGMWMGGFPPLGYDVMDRKLIVNEAAAETVRHILQRYLELGSVHSLKAELDAQGVVNKVRVSQSGRRWGGKPLARGALYRMLQNRIYLGEIVHKDKSYPGDHEPIIGQDRSLAGRPTYACGKPDRTQYRPQCQGPKSASWAPVRWRRPPHDAESHR